MGAKRTSELVAVAPSNEFDAQLHIADARVLAPDPPDGDPFDVLVHLLDLRDPVGDAQLTPVAEEERLHIRRRVGHVGSAHDPRAPGAAATSAVYRSATIGDVITGRSAYVAIPGAAAHTWR